MCAELLGGWLVLVWFASRERRIAVNERLALLETRSDAQERQLQALKMDMDDLWDRVQRHQAKSAARARRDVAKDEPDPHTPSIDDQIKEGTYRG